MGQKHKKFREFRTPFPPATSAKIYARAAREWEICSKNSKIVPYHRDSPNRGILVYNICLISISNLVSDGATNKSVLNIER